MSEFTLSASFVVQSTEIPEKVEDFFRQFADRYPSADLAADLAAAPDTYEVGIMAGVTVDLMGNFHAPAEDASVLDRIAHGITVELR